MSRTVELRLMKATLLLIIATVLLVAGCSSESKQTQPVTSRTDSGTSTAPPAKEVGQRDNALVRVINAVPGNTSFDIFADDQKVFESVAFKGVTPYRELSDVRHSFRVRHAGQDSAQPLSERSEGLTGGKHYTIVVMPGTNDKTALYLINDNITTPPADKAQVRVIHASPDAGDVDIVDKQGNRLFSGVDFEKETNYTDVDPKTMTLEVRQEGQDRALVTVPAIFQKGRFYTIVVTGHAKGTPRMQTVMVEDQLATATTASASPEGKIVKTSSKY